MVSGDQGRLLGGSGLVSRDLNHKEDLKGKERQEKHPKYKKSTCKRPGGKQHGTFEELYVVPISMRESEVGVR